MEQLHYLIEDDAIIELLGRQNFTNKESAILELVKNAYDSGAMECRLIFGKDDIKIIDNGCGMSAEDIRKHWMTIGKSNKPYSSKDSKNNERVLSGSKGIGRLALARLGSDVTVTSKKEHYSPIKWHTNWRTSELDDFPNETNTGTQLHIKNLRDKWKEKDINFLISYISRSYNDNAMSIFLEYNDKTTHINRFFSDWSMGEHFVTKIQLTYNAEEQTLNCNITSDEFLKEAKEYCKDININSHFTKFNINDELKGNKDIQLENDEIKNHLKNLGDFTSELYFGINSSKKDEEKFLYKYRNLPKKEKTNIILYRNAFSISSYNGDNDWLKIDSRARKSPAAATHPTGSWRVRSNQIQGKVIIDKKTNKNLVDLSNRQGLDENIYYQLLKEILYIGLSEFERYRQGIIREINKKNIIEEKEETYSLIKNIIKNPNSLKDIASDKEKTNELQKELKDEETKVKQISDNYHETEKQYKYDVRILNTLATAGLKAASVAHELKNDISNIGSNYDFIIQAMKKYNIWEIVNKPENRTKSYYDIPALLENNKDINEKFILFMRQILTDIEKKAFIPKSFNVYELITEIKKTWCNDYAGLTINLVINEYLQFKSYIDNIKVIMDNLILNSIQQNGIEDLKINIKIEKIDNKLYIEYKDNGKGLDAKYKNNPKKILEVHETTRKDGHGLGMWMINNGIKSTGGEIIDIKGDNGFYFYFNLGDKIYG